MSHGEYRYVVVVCPKCHRNAQIVEDRNQKNIRCQNCGASLQLRKLRRFHSSQSLDKAIEARAGIQAELLKHQKNNKTVSSIEIDASRNVETADERTYWGKDPIKFIFS